MPEELTEVQQKSIATYIQRLDHELKKITKIEEIDKLPMQLGLNYLKKDEPLELLKYVVYKAMGRKTLICDYEDSKHPHRSTGRCSDDQHYENNEEPIVPFTEQQQKEFNEIGLKEGVYHAQIKFIDNFNPDNQELSLVLGFEEEDQKLDDDEPSYVCSQCLEVLNDNADGTVACDMDDAE